MSWIDRSGRAWLRQWCKSAQKTTHLDELCDLMPKYLKQLDVFRNASILLHSRRRLLFVRRHLLLLHRWCGWRVRSVSCYAHFCRLFAVGLTFGGWLHLGGCSRLDFVLCFPSGVGGQAVDQCNDDLLDVDFRVQLSCRGEEGA
jgi:hypothetical protein